jgi:hypothetical protein
MPFFLKGLRFITPKAFSELLKLSREYQMLTVTKVTDFRWTRSQRVQSNSVTSLRLQKRSPTLIGIALQVNRAESLPFVSIRVASLLLSVLKGEPCCLLAISPRPCTARLLLRALLLPSPSPRSTVQNRPYGV